MNKIIFSRGLLCAFLAGISSFSALADPVISEFLASNSTGLQDEDGQRNDWIEIFNPDATAVNLDGWYLTDSKTNKTKWRIPNVTLAPRAYLFVWASNKNRSNPANPLHTNFRISASAGGYVGLIRPALTVASEFDAYPIQAADITYGLPVVQTTNTLVANAAAAKFTVPADGSLGSTWTAPSFADGGWTGVTSGVGFDLEPGPMPTVRQWADSQTEFSSTQGSNNWHYGIWNRTTDTDKVYTPADAFLFLRDGTNTLSAANHWNGSSWAMGGYPPWTGIHSTGGHPNGSNNGAEHWVLRRYVSEFTGSARLSGFVSHPAVSDGVGLHIFVDGREVYMHSAIRTRSHEFSINVPVQLGSLVDFFVDAGEAANDGGDSFNSIFRVQSGAIADSATDWSTAGTQGARNWRYGYYRRSADGDATYQTTDFTAFLRDATTTISATNHWDGTRWVLSTSTAPLTALNANGGVPQTTGATDWPVRRWTSPYAGRVAIHGIVGHPDAGSDGITGRLYLNGTQIFSRTVNDSNEPYLVFADVLVGSVLDFAIDPGATETADSNAGFTAFITPAASGAQLVADSITDWSTSGTQGALGWTYGMFNKIIAGNVPYAANLFTAFLRDNTNTLSATNQWTGSQYDIFNGNPPWTELGVVSTHPNGDGAGGNQQWPIRRWTSTVAGSLTVQAHVGKLNTSGGGVTLKVFLNGVERDSFVIAGSSKIGSTRLVALEGVQVGDHIDIAVTPEGIGDLGDGADGCRFSARIYRNATPPNAVYSDVADSVLDWSTTGVQGFRGWTYGTHNEATPGGNSYTGANFIPFPRASGGWGVTNYWNGSYYDVPAGNPPWTELGQTGVHPNGVNSTGGEQWIIRRWTSTTAGSLRLTYKAWKTNPNGSGVSIRAFHNGTQIDTVAVAGNNSTGTTRVVVIPNVAIGDNIDVALTPIGTGGQTDDGSDGAAFSATIARVSTISDSVGSNVASAMLGANASSYLRVPFNLASLPSLDNLKFRVRYDDGFVAYLNGTEVARRNAPVAQTGAVLANSVTEHSGVQGQNNWFYGFYPKSLDPDGVYHPNSDFISMDPNWTFSGSTWLMGPGDPPWTFMNSGGGHPNGPNSGVTQWPIKRWVAEAAGTMTANIRLVKPVNCGEGTTLRLFHNGTEVWKQTSGFNEPIGFWPRVQLTDVKVGDFIDLALDATGVGEATGDACDSTTYNMTIIQSPSTGLAWNSSATRSRDTAAVGNTEEIDLTTQLSLITTGDNVLAIHGLNAARNDSDFLIAPTLSGTSTAIAGSGGVYFLGASPSTTNGLGSTTIGPIVKDATNSVIAGDADNIVVTAKITRSLDPIGPARLRYRVMYGPEIELPFLDDGLSGDGAAGDGVYGAAIPASASAPGEMVRWRIVSEDSNGDVTRSPTFHDAADSPEYWGTVITTPNVVPGSQIGVFHWFTADTGGSDGSGARGSIYYNGQFLDNVFVDVHGQSSLGFPKKSYDFKLNTSHKLAWDPTPMNNTPRVNSFNLLTTYPDKAAIRNLLSYDVFDTAGVAGHAVIPIQVRRNNNFFSLAHFMEDGDEDFLQREPGLDDLGSLYKMYSTFDSIAGAEKKSRRWETNGDLVTFQAGLLLGTVPRERFIYDNAGIPETINYLSALTMTGNDDVGHKNYYLYRDTVGNGEWRVLPWDQDLSFGRVWRPEYNYFGDVMVSDTSLFLGGGNLFMKRFVDNSIPALRQMHLRRLRTLADTLLNQSTVPLAQRFFENRIDVLKTFVKPEADYERLNNVWPSWGTAQTVDQAIDLIKDDYLPNRRNYVFTHPDLPPPQDPMVVVNFGTVEFDPDSHNQAQEYFTIVNPSATVAVDVSGWVIGGGVNHVLKPGTVIPANGTLYLSPDVVAFRARTVGPRGNQSLFVQGNYNGQLSARGETLTLMDGVRLVSTLTYTGDPTAAQTNLRITEIMYNPGLLTGSTFATGEYEYIELRNTSTTLTLDLTGVRFTAGCDFAFTSGTMLAPGAFAVIAKNTTAFAQRYPTTTPAGVFLGALNNGGDRITLLDADNEEIHDFDYQDTWHPLTDGAGFSLQTVDQAALFSDWNLATQWRPSGKLNGTPGALDSVGDFDNDGMSDLWEAQNGLNPTNPADANLDLDFDGQTNLEEFIAGTVPGSSVSRFAITSNTQADGTFNGSFPGIAGKTYTVQYSESLSSGTWQNLSNHAPVANGSVPFTDTPPANHPRRFYRIITPQLP